jgi:hypothetical protein
MACALACAFAAQPPARAQQRESTWGQILIAGGRQPSTDEETVDNSVEFYDPASNNFVSEIATPQLKIRLRATATVLVSGPNAGMVLIAGGDNRNSVPRSSTELYDPAANTVVDGPAMKTPRSGHTATTIPIGPNGGEILLAGGAGVDGNELSSTELYNPAIDRFSSGPPMSAACSFCTATVIATGKNAGRILIAGSCDGGGRTARLELYDPVADKFISGPKTNIRRIYSATPIRSGKNAGKMLMVGGIETPSEKIVALTALYDPDANTLSLGPEPKIIRNGHTANLITSGPNAGKILLAGGGGYWFNDSPTLTSTELYDPESNAFSPGPSMNNARARHTATAILSGKNAGKILIAGGVNSRGRGPLAMLSSTELYDPATNTFAPGPKMNWDRADAVAVQLPPAPLDRR